jgi:peptidoglycan glycosyltransferase
MAAQEAMAGRKGTIALMNYKTGEILCAVTTPNYNPDNPPNLSEADSNQYEAVYMNRFIQSKYTPGSIFKIVTSAAALEEIDDIWDQTFTCTGEVDYGTYDVTCEKVHGKLDFDSALAESCNCAFSQIVEQLGKEKLLEYVDKYNVTQSVSFDGATTASGNFDLTDTSRLDVAWSGIGQHRDEVNPCRYLTFISAIANGGLEVQPYLMEKITCEGETTYQATVKYGEQIMSQTVASELQHMLRNNVIEKYGEENFPDLQVCGKSGTAQVGGGKDPNAMFTGFVLDEECPVAFFVAVEGGGYGRQTCVPILSEVLEACMNIL